MNCSGTPGHSTVAEVVSRGAGKRKLRWCLNQQVVLNAYSNRTSYKLSGGDRGERSTAGGTSWSNTDGYVIKAFSYCKVYLLKEFRYWSRHNLNSINMVLSQVSEYKGIRCKTIKSVNYTEDNCAKRTANRLIRSDHCGFWPLFSFNQLNLTLLSLFPVHFQLWQKYCNFYLKSISWSNNRDCLS